MKKYSRRDFLKTAAITTAGLYVAPSLVLASQNNPYINYDFSRDTEEITVARIACGEGAEMFGTCGEMEIPMMLLTMVNRANNQFKWDGKTAKEAALTARPVRENGIMKKDKNGYTVYAHQYSCLNKWDPNLKKIKNPGRYYGEELWIKAVDTSTKTLEGKFPHLNLGQSHYYRKGSKVPEWANSPRMERVWSPENSKHIFYRDTKAKLKEKPLYCI